MEFVSGKTVDGRNKVAKFRIGKSHDTNLSHWLNEQKKTAEQRIFAEKVMNVRLSREFFEFPRV